MNFISYFRTLKMIHVGLVSGQVLFLLITTYLVYFKDIAKEDVVTHNVFMTLIPLMVVADIFIGYFMFKKKLKAIRKKSSLAQKLSQYQSDSIMRYGLIEGGGLFSIIAFLIVGSILYLFLAVISIILLSLLHPTEFRIKSELKLSPSEIATLQNPDFNIRSDL